MKDQNSLRQKQILDIARDDNRFVTKREWSASGDNSRDIRIGFNLAELTLNIHYVELGNSSIEEDGYILQGTTITGTNGSCPGIYKITEVKIDRYGDKLVGKSLIEEFTDEMSIDEIRKKIFNFVKKEIATEIQERQKDLENKINHIIKMTKVYNGIT